jgi:membrane-bound lytic murein transglycosylase B
VDGLAPTLRVMGTTGRCRSRLTSPARAVAVLVAFGMLASCSTDRAQERPSPGARATATVPTVPSSAVAPPSASSAAPERGNSPAIEAAPRQSQVLPPVPPRRAAELAKHLERMGATLRDPQAAPDAVRRAGRFQQLAARSLATRSRAFRREVIDKLSARTARIVHNDVEASLLLHALSDPQRSLPDWRIVHPPGQERLVSHYRRAERRTGVPWEYLAAIHLVETRMGRIRGVSSAGARGPMQFLPSTWDLYGAGGDINDPRDAILAAARLLKANGAPGDMAEALWHYNPSQSYVGAVSRYARTVQRWPSTYRGYWHWRVLYQHRKGTYVLPVGYPDTPPVPLSKSSR